MVNDNKNPERTLVHNLNNHLTVLNLGLRFLNEDLGPDNPFRVQLEELTRVSEAAIETVKTYANLYRDSRPQVQYVDADGLSDKVRNYTVVHVDDSIEIRNIFYDALTKGSNIRPEHDLRRGMFAHDGVKVSYIVHSCNSIQQALGTIPLIGNIDLLVTDREMPNRDGEALLQSLNLGTDYTARRPEFNNVKSLAMLTGGISKTDAQRIMDKYGIKILTKPIESPEEIEARVYSAINQS